MNLNPKTGATIGYQETKGTTAEPFNVPMAWQPSTLSYVSLSLDSAGNLNTNGAGGTITTVSVEELTNLQVASATITYIGNAAIGSATSSAVWKIKRLDSTGGNTVILYAGGAPTYNQIFDNRAALSYS